MKKRLVRSLAAAILGLTAILPGAAAPAPITTAEAPVVIAPPDSKDTGFESPRGGGA